MRLYRTASGSPIPIYFATAVALLAIVTGPNLEFAQTAPVTLTAGRLRVSISGPINQPRERVEILDGSAWVEALNTEGVVTRSTSGGGVHSCVLRSSNVSHGAIVMKADCGVGTLERELRLGPEADMVSVSVRYTPNSGATLTSVEDRLTFAPLARKSDAPLEGPLDFVWSQDIKAIEDDLIPHFAFKSPTVMFQQGRVFAAIVPRVDLLTAANLVSAPPAMDLNVTSGPHAWFSYGVVPSKPEGHSYFRRDPTATLELHDGAVEYQYWIVASAQREKLGYQRVAKLLWEKFGGPGLKASMDLQRNVRRPELFLFDDWRQEAWTRYANEKYWEFNCGGRRCGALTSNRNPWGKWDDAPKEDAWFNSWFQNLRTAYGWCLHAQRARDPEMARKAEQILNLALSSPRDHGVFSTIYLHDKNMWLRDDGWAGYADDYHTFCMSWTGYWMLRWAEDLVPGRKQEIVDFLRSYAVFLADVQEKSGCIPSWFDTELKPRAEFGEFNAETAGSALFLAEFAHVTGDRRSLDVAVRAADFISQQVIPRQRWYDFETFLSCARKPFDFYDHWTAQYPQNNLSQIQAAQAFLKLYELTGNNTYLEAGERVVDYLLLTQQVWNHPLFSPQLVGGTTTQNTDAEWSDARQCYLATLLLDYYKSTGRLDLLERSVAAARSGFAVAPWENWAHTGHVNAPGSLTGFHWGTGSEMTSVEILSGSLGDAFVNVARKQGVGFNACTLDDVHISGTTIDFRLAAEASPKQGTKQQRRLLVRFDSVEPSDKYKLTVNGGRPVVMQGKVLATEGYWATVDTVE